MNNYFRKRSNEHVLLLYIKDIFFFSQKKRYV